MFSIIIITRNIWKLERAVGTVLEIFRVRSVVVSMHLTKAKNQVLFSQVFKFHKLHVTTKTAQLLFLEILNLSVCLNRYK